jgi:hypothetical protein
MAQQPLHRRRGFIAAGNCGDSGKWNGGSLLIRDGAQSDACLHARGQALEQRFARQGRGLRLGGSAGQEARQRCRQHVEAARAERYLRALRKRQRTAVGLSTGDLEAGLAVAGRA